MSLDAATQKKLNHEADLRFWSGIGYNPGQKLDPHDKWDAPMIPIWKSIYDNVLAQYNAGTLAWTQDSPGVQSLVAGAANAAAGVVSALGKAASAADVAVQAEALADAGAAHKAAQEATKAVGMASGALSGPVVHPSVVQAAADHIAANPPPVRSPADVAKAMQVASAPGHAHEVMTFSMQNGRGVPTGWAPSTAVNVTPSDLPVADADLAERHRNLASWKTPLLALGAVGGAVLLGSLIVNVAKPKRRGGRRRLGAGAARVELVAGRR